VRLPWEQWRFFRRLGTDSNLTFTGIQVSIALTLGFD